MPTETLDRVWMHSRGHRVDTLSKTAFPPSIVAWISNNHAYFLFSFQTLPSCPINCVNRDEDASSEISTNPQSANQNQSGNDTNTTGNGHNQNSTDYLQCFNLSTFRSRLPDINCWNKLPLYRGNSAPSSAHVGNEKGCDSSDNACDINETTSNNNTNYNNNNIIGYNFGTTGVGNGSNYTKETPLHRFYRAQQKKMPAFRGKRGWCGCFKVSCKYICVIWT